jgi:hypothetical protein
VSRQLDRLESKGLPAWKICEGDEGDVYITGGEIPFVHACYDGDYGSTSFPVKFIIEWAKTYAPEMLK